MQCSQRWARECDNKEDGIWCKRQIDEHPDCVPYLASLFRRGTFEKMMRQEQINEEQREKERMHGRPIHSRVRKMDRLPASFKETFLKTINQTIDTTSWPEEVVDRAFSFALFLDSATPSHTSPECRYEGALLKACIKKYTEIGRPLDVSFRAVEVSVDNFNFFKISEDRATFAFLPLKQTFGLPGGAAPQWTLKDESELSCVAIAPSFKRLLPTVARSRA